MTEFCFLQSMGAVRKSAAAVAEMELSAIEKHGDITISVGRRIFQNTVILPGNTIIGTFCNNQRSAFPF